MLAGFLMGEPLFHWAGVGCGSPRWPRTVRKGRGREGNLAA
jgi:hypothetical protein